MNKYLKHSITLFIFIFMVTGVSGPAWSYVAHKTTPGKWGNPTYGTGATVTWSLIPTGTDYTDEYYNKKYNTGTFTSFGDLFVDLSGWKSEVESAFDAWSSVANINFIEVTDNGTEHSEFSTGIGDIRLGGQPFDGLDGILAHAYYPPDNNDSASGDVHLDIAEEWKIGFEGEGFDVFSIMAHEIGHAIGLGHEEEVYGAIMNPFYTQSFHGLQADDIAGAQYIYGPNVVPEPLSSSLFGVGAVFFYFRKRFKKA